MISLIRDVEDKATSELLEELLLLRLLNVEFGGQKGLDEKKDILVLDRSSVLEELEITHALEIVEEELRTPRYPLSIYTPQQDRVAHPSLVLLTL